MGVMLNMAGVEQYRTLALPHHDLVEALRQRDPEVAKEAIRAHLTVARDGAARVNLGPTRGQKRALALENFSTTEAKRDHLGTPVAQNRH
jgi:hypothetical protein